MLEMRQPEQIRPRQARRGTDAPSASAYHAPQQWVNSRPPRKQGTLHLRPGSHDVEHSPKSCVAENPVGPRTPSATNRRARARQGDGGEEKAEDVASAMSHGATVGPHPRRTGWGLFPYPAHAAAGAQEAPGPPERRTQVGPGTYPCERWELEAGVRRGGGSPAEPLPSRRPRRYPAADRS